MFAGYVTDPKLDGPRVSRDGLVHDGWLNTGDLGRLDADGFVYLTGRAKDLIIRGGHNIDPRVIEEALLGHPAVVAAAAVGRPDQHSGEVPVAYVVPADPDRFDEAELMAWAATAIDEPAARPKHIYPITAIPTTEVGKYHKPTLVADAAVRAVADALASGGARGPRHPGGSRARSAGRHRGRRRPRPAGRRGRGIRPHRQGYAVNRPAITDGVIVVGAGPVGCTAALLLADRGIPVTLLERHTRPHPLPRAVHLDDEVARILHRVGVSEAFLANSRPGSGLRLLDAQHRVLAEFRREAQPGDNGFPAANMFHQPDLDALLFDRVAEHPLIDLQRGVEVHAIDGVREPLTAAPVAVLARRLEDETTQTFTGRLVLGCDGANSTVRQLVGLTMQDLGFTERWLVVDVRADRDLDTWDGVEQVCDPARAATFMQVTGDRYRWEFQLHDGEDEADLTHPAGPRPTTRTLDPAPRPRRARRCSQRRIHLPGAAGDPGPGRASVPPRRRRPPHPTLHRPGAGVRAPRRRQPRLEDRPRPDRTGDTGPPRHVRDRTPPPRQSPDTQGRPGRLGNDRRAGPRRNRPPDRTRRSPSAARVCATSSAPPPHPG